MAGFWAFFAAFFLVLGLPARAEDGDTTITIKGDKFLPDEVRIPADRKVKLTVRNLDAAPSEFESSDFHREKIVAPGGEITVFVGPLDAGTYEFFDDFHPEDRGHLVVK
ncbi:MAG: cupredoxin domain-containing protein [Alphaproteobacteria bacterium]|nr:cupredoxin domain-containing protein [Alphaproteobacteria bacterium]